MYAFNVTYNLVGAENSIAVVKYALRKLCGDTVVVDTTGKGAATIKVPEEYATAVFVLLFRDDSAVTVQSMYRLVEKQ